MSLRAHSEREEPSNVAIVDGSNVAHSTEGQPPLKRRTHRRHGA